MHISSYLNNGERGRRMEEKNLLFIFLFLRRTFLRQCLTLATSIPPAKHFENIPEISNTIHPCFTWIKPNTLLLLYNLTLKIKADINPLRFFFFFSHSKFFSLPVLDYHFPWSVVSCQTSAVSFQVTPWLTGNCVKILISRSSATFSFVA